MTGKQMLMKLTSYTFIEEGFNQWDRNARGKRRSWHKSRMKKASKKIRYDKCFLKEIEM